MRGFLVKVGTNVNVVRFKGQGYPTLVPRVIKKEVMYFLEDIKVDPQGTAGVGPQHKTVGGSWARQGYYGFSLPKNKDGYEIMLVHANDITVV